MTTKQRLPLVMIAALLLGFMVPAAAAAPPAPAPTKGEKAGSITALLPIAHIERGAGKAKVMTDAKKGDEIIWNDNIKTERGGRARITLNDQSILSLGSQAELRVVKHDSRSQQTALALQYGRIRAEVAKVTRQGGSFELRTPTAVAGVIGTDFGTDASTPGVTTFLCISGLVQVSNSDPNIAGSVQCAPGLTTTVAAGKAPTPPTNATPAQIQQLIQDTEPAIIAAMSPMNALPGAAVDVTITGTKLAGVKGVSSTGSGLTTSLVGTPTDTAVTVHVAIAKDAQPGPRMITLTKSSGAASAAMFTVLSPPNVTQGDPKKAYLDALTQEAQSTRGGLTSFLATVQQAADQALQQLQQANQANLNINDAQNAFSSQLTVLQNAINTAGQQIDDGAAQASSSFQQQYDALYQALLQRHPDGTPDDQFNQAVQALFASINGSLGNTFSAIRSNLSSVVTSTNTNIAQLQQTWMQTLTAASNPPVPVVNSTERSIDLGAAFGNNGIAALDAGNSKAAGGASIVSYKWVLCDSSYKPAQFGVPLAGNATAGCNPISGYTSSSADFGFATCNLASADYIARVTVVDSNSVSAAMDVKVHVLPATYDDPATRLRNLAQAYMTLQPNNFLSFFDDTGFSGFTALSENVRNTFPLLASMQINPRVSQAAITCNDATVRADWVQNYTYKQNPNVSFSQTEQLSARMVRQPGKGWNIVDFQGDNGTVQGQLPGPAVTDTAQPDLVTLAVFPSYAGGASTNPPVPPGAQSFTAVVQNIGGADFTATTVVRFQLLDATNTAIGNPVDVPLPTPLAAGATTNLQATLNVPAFAVGTSFSVLANANPTCLPEAHCDASNQATEALILGTPVKLTQVTTPTLQVGGAAGTLTISVSAAAPVTITLPTGITTSDPLTQTTTGAGNVTWHLVAGFTATAGGNQTLTVSASAGIPVTLAATYSVAAPAFTQTNVPSLTSGATAAQPLTVNVNVPGTYTLVLPSGVTTTSPNPQTITSATGGALTWNVLTSFTAATGTGLFANVTSGIYSFAAKYNNAGQANYIITSVTFAGHTAPYTGANAMQVGESTNLVAVIQNVGNASPTGTITATGTCVPLNPNDTKSCSGGGNPTATVPAPVAGQSVTVTMPVDFKGMIPGSFNGTVTLTTTIAQSSTADDTLSLPFDTTDFTVTVQNPLSPQNILPGTTQTVTVVVQTFGTTPYPVSLSTSAGYTGISFTPATTSATPGTPVSFTVTAASSTAVGGFGATIAGTNHGVTRPGVESFLVMAPSIVSTNLFLNDASNPLEIQMGNTTPADVSLKLSGAAFSGTATLIPPTSVVGFTTSINPTTSILANGTFDLTVSASTSATTVVTPMHVTAQLPNTNPVLSISYTLYVKALGLADLKIVSATPSFDFTAAPWIDGQGVDYSVQVQNIGNSPSAGGEEVTVEVNGVVAGTNALDSANQLKVLSPGASQTITVHAVAPDVHGSNTFGPQTVSGRVRVHPEANGETDYTNNSFALSIPMANWHIALNESAPVQLVTSAGGGSTIAYFSGAIDGSSFTSYPGLIFVPTQGQVSTSFTVSNFAQPGDPACGLAAAPPANTMFCATLATGNGTLQPGLYYAQLLVSTTDPVSGKTTQRQATVPIQVNRGTNGATVSLASSANNCSGTSCAGTTGSTLQINGGLSEQFTVTMSMTCNVNSVITPCAGTADLAIHDAGNTQTTALASTSAVATGTPLLLRVAAALDPNGYVISGPASGYAIAVNGVQHSAVRTGASPPPDPVGTSVPFNINVGDLQVTANTGANFCTGVIAGGTPLQLNVQWNVLNGFNAPAITWQWQDGNHSPVGASPLSFTNAIGSASFSGGYSPATFTLTNNQAKDGVTPYFLAVTITNGTSTATKYFPFFFDLSLGQNFCGAVSSARGYSVIQGSWSRSAAALGGPIASLAAPQSRSAASDVHIAASDVSFMPSMPKVGDAVQVRFRARNDGDVDATGIPIALQINGVTVASDTFDVPKGRTVLGGLTWTAAADVAQHAVSSGARRPLVKGKIVDPDSAPASDDATLLAGAVQLQAAVVVDPQHVTKQKTTLEKSAAISHLSLRGTPSSTTGAVVATNSQRILIELEDGACVGLRLSSGGTMPCGSADLEITIGDLAKSLLSFDSLSGVGEIGTAFETARRASGSAVRYSGQAAASSGHTYSVQLPNGNTATVNVESVRNPAELDAKAQALFRASAARVMRNMGDSSTPNGPGDLTGSGTHPTVFIVLNVQGM